jgi:hypothetical protein
MPEDDLPDPDKVQDQMRSAIERIRAKLTELEAEPKSEVAQAEGQTDELP